MEFENRKQHTTKTKKDLDYINAQGLITHALYHALNDHKFFSSDVMQQCTYTPIELQNCINNFAFKDCTVSLKK